MSRSKLIRDKAKNIVFNRDRNQKRRVNFYLEDLYFKENIPDTDNHYLDALIYATSNIETPKKENVFIGGFDFGKCKDDNGGLIGKIHIPSFKNGCFWY